MAGKGTGGKKQRKFGRNADYCKTYKMAGVEDKNRRRTMRRHLRRNPGDLQSANRFEVTFGKVSDIGLASRGKKLKQRAETQGLRPQPSGPSI